MKYLIIFILLLGCGIRPSASCTVDLKDKETLDEVKAECIENPKIGLKKEF